MSALFGVVIVMGGFVLCALVIDVVAVAGCRFLGSGCVGVWEGRLLWRFAVGMCCWGRG